MTLLCKGARLVDPQVGLDEVADLIIEDGKIAQVGQNLSIEEGEVRDFAGKIIVPGLVDVHVHLREPGYEHKETIASGTACAARGGFTAVCSMPNTNPCTDTAHIVEFVKSAAEAAGHCRVVPSGACTQGLKGETLSEMGDMYAHGAKAFTDDGRGIQSSSMMRRVMEYAKQFDVCVMVHAQDEDLVGAGQVNEGVVSTRLGLQGWPAEGEELEIQRDISLCRLTGCPLHIQHITTKRGLDMVRAAKAEGLPVTCEVTPHHLFLCEDDITTAYPTSMKVNPPLRTADDAKGLIEGVVDGSIDCIVTDHAPHAAWEKDREFELAPFGMIGLETSLPLMLTNLVHQGVIDYARLVEMMAVNPRKILRVERVAIEAGSTADLTVIDPDFEWTYDVKESCSKSSNSAFNGVALKGRASDVFVGGRETLRNAEVIA